MVIRKDPIDVEPVEHEVAERVLEEAQGAP